MKPRQMRILTVCTGNTCRSPLAQAVLARLLPEAEVVSAGMAAVPGQQATDWARVAAREKGYNLDEHRSRPVTEELVRGADLVLTMTASQRDRLLARWPDAAGRVFTLAEYAGTEGDVADPFGGDLDRYRACLAEIEGLAQAAARRAQGEFLGGKDMAQQPVRVGVGCDHAGFPLKQVVMDAVRAVGMEPVDFGTTSTAACDYPDFAKSVGEAVVSGQVHLGVLICGTGIGMAIAANKVRGVRAATANDLFTARLSREHNDANVLCLGARVVGPGVAEEIVRTWLQASFQGGRHLVRVDKVRRMEGDAGEG